MMYNTNSNISGMNNSSSGQTNEHHTESMIISNNNNNNNNNNSNQILGLDQQIQLDSLSNLFINNWETDDAALEQYENEMDRTINENLLLEKEQSNQRLFQSFQTSACAVAQMFKDKTAAASAAVTSNNNNNTSSNMSSWQSFQNSAGAITVLYKDSLEACKEHMDLGICIGQQRKLKEIITWIKKKKKRTIRKDELISFLIGKQYTNTSNQNQMFNLFNPNTNNNIGLNTNNNLISNNASNMSITSQQQQQTASSLTTNNRRQQSLNRLQQSQLSRSNSTTNNNNAITNTNTVGSTLNPAGENSSGSNDSQAVETNSDLATFREALIMHNRSRDAPLNRSHHNQHHHNQNNNHHHHHHNHINHLNHHNQQNLYHSQQQQQNNNSITNNNSTSISTNQTNPQTNITSTNVGMPTPNCDDLDCFFCEQIATHIEHKRSAANSNSFNLDMESPTRKRGRFY